METGQLVPDQLVLDMLVNHAKSSSGNLLLDGYPRTIVQAQSLQVHINIDCVVALDIPHQTIIDRLSGRWIHAGSGRTYAYDYNPPKILGKDDITGEPLIQREDDKPASIAARLQAYEKLTLPLKQYYDKQGILKVFAGTESDVIYPHIKSYLSTVIPK